MPEEHHLEYSESNIRECRLSAYNRDLIFVSYRKLVSDISTSNKTSEGSGSNGPKSSGRGLQITTSGLGSDILSTNIGF